RLHHQWLPDEIHFDQPPPADLVLDLTRRGHAVADTRKSSIVQAILIRDGKLIGASDPRGGGMPAGW
ncbi:MAG: gamma-glutamyltransferase, partial [Phycisphaerales bacterium]